MHWLFFMFRFFPYWALPLVLLGFETGIYFKRRRRFKGQFSCWFVAVFLAILIGVWFFYRGDVHSDHWVRILLRQE
jgi:hypothetical protein